MIFFLYKKDIRTYILLVFSCLDHYLKLHCLLWMRTSNVITHNITCTGSHHYLFSDQIFLKKNLIILHKNNFFFFQSFSFSRAPCSSAFRLKDAWNNIQVGSFSRNADEQGAREGWKTERTERAFLSKRYRKEQKWLVFDDKWLAPFGMLFFRRGWHG